MTDFEISGGAFPRTSWSRAPDPLTGHSAQDAKLDDPLCNICHSHLIGNIVETSSLNLIITFDRASFHQSVDKSLICQYYYHCYWLEKLALVFPRRASATCFTKWRQFFMRLSCYNIVKVAVDPRTTLIILRRNSLSIAGHTYEKLTLNCLLRQQIVKLSALTRWRIAWMIN